MRIIEFVVSGPPMAKGRVRFVRRTGHVYPPERTVRYEGRLALAAQEAMNGRPPVEGPVAVRLWVRLPIPKSWPVKRALAAELGHLRPTSKPDVDNYLKILDALNGIIWADDSQIVSATVSKHYAGSPGMTIAVDEWLPDV